MEKVKWMHNEKEEMDKKIRLYTRTLMEVYESNSNS